MDRKHNVTRLGCTQIIFLTKFFSFPCSTEIISWKFLTLKIKMPGFQCTFKDCGSDSLSRDVSFFQFPRSDPELQLWIDFVKKYPGWQPKPSSRLCSMANKTSLSLTDEYKTRSIARARIHIERFNQRMKIFQFVSGTVSHSKKHLLPQAIYVSCFLANYTPNLVE